MDTYGTEDILHISLTGTLSTEQRLALHHPLCLLLWLIGEQKQPRILNVQQLTSGEARVLVPLLQSFPAYSPHALVLASIEVSSVAEAQERLDTAWLQGEEAWTLFLQPLRKVLGGLRQKLQSCGTDLVAVQRRGYLLKQWTEKHKQCNTSDELRLHANNIATMRQELMDMMIMHTAPAVTRI